MLKLLCVNPAANLSLCLEKGVRYMRADTDYPNERMQHVLKKNGFVLCGEIFYQGGGRLAYDKML